MRTLKAEEIEVRVGHKKNNGVAMLLYIDSRAVTKYLDEWVGPMNWQTEFNTAGPLVVGKLGIWDEKKQQWIWKSDTGSESNIEAEKGLISDTYKRLLSRWGVTELYTAPDIVLPDDGYNNSGYKVSEIDYDNNRNIIHLVIVNRFGKEMFRWDVNNKPQPQRQVILDHITPESLEWTPEDNRQPVASIQMTKQLTNDEKLTQWFNTIPNPDPQTIKFYQYYMSKINNGQWKGAINIEKLFYLWQQKSA